MFEIDIKTEYDVKLEAEELELIALIVKAARDRQAATVKYTNEIRLAILTELYVRKYNVFHFIKKRKIKFKTSEIIALRDALFHLPLLQLDPDVAYVDIVRNNIIEKLNKCLKK